MITREVAKKVVETVDAGLRGGIGRPIPGQMCVEAAVCYAQGLPHGDKPTCVNDVLRLFKIGLNDANWSSKAARAKGMRKLAVLQLGTDKCFDEKDFIKRLTFFTIKTIVPIALRAAIAVHYDNSHKAALEDAATACEVAADLSQAIKASDAARYAANAAYEAANAAYAAYDAARHLARHLASDAVLNIMAEGAAQILIEMGVPGTSFLDLL